MVRISKKDRLKHCPRKPKYPAPKTGALKDNLPKGFKEHANALPDDQVIYVAKVK